MSEQTPAPDTPATPPAAETKPAPKAAPKKAATAKASTPKKSPAGKKPAAPKAKAAPKKPAAPNVVAKPTESLEQATEKSLELLKLSRAGSQEIVQLLVKANTDYWTRSAEITKTLAEADSPEAFLEAEQSFVQAQIEEMTKVSREVFELANKTTTAVLEDLQRFSR